MVKFVLREVLLLYGHSSTDRAVTKQRYGEIFIETRDKADMSVNITAGYRATGISPINPSFITDATFAPSLTHSEDAQFSNDVTATETSTASLLSHQKNRNASPLSGTCDNFV